MRFLVYPAEFIPDWPEAYRAFVSGIDGRVFPTRVEFDGNMLVCRRQVSDSGKFHVSWPVPGFGRPVISTSSLREQEGAYLLPIELARGKISQVRDQLSAWELAGMAIPEEFRPVHREAHHLFGHATASQGDPDEACAVACRAIAKACEAAEILTRTYINQRLTIRRRRSPQLPVSLGCNLGFAPPEESWSEPFCRAFNSAVVPVEWRFIESQEGEQNWEINDAQVEWCEKHKLMMRGGPLLDLSPKGLPQWLWQWEHDIYNFQSFVSDFVETAISRYVGRIRIWEVASCVNTGGAMALNEENRLTLVARVLETARRVDEESQLFIRVDQPWGEYQARGQHRLTPMQFIDALVRSGAGIAGINLEIGVGYRPQASSPRDLLDVSRLIDVWSTLALPLHVTLAFPSATGGDAESKSDLEVDSESWKTKWSEESQAEWIESYVPLLMSKQAVTGVFWSHFSDAAPHDFPHAGLLRADGGAKRALQEFISQRESQWEG